MPPFDDRESPWRTSGGPGAGRLTPAPDSQPGPRRGPLSSRLQARSLGSHPLPSPASQPGGFDPSAAAGYANSPAADTTAARWRGSQPASAHVDPHDWEVVTGPLRTPAELAEALRNTPHFNAVWNSRAEMLSACLNEYFQLTSRYNDTVKLLQEMTHHLSALRRQRDADQAAMRALEAQLELHSRTELRTAYLAAAESEMRLFKAQEERDLLQTHVDTLEGFLSFLSRVVATVRTIPAEMLARADAQASFPVLNSPTAPSVAPVNTQSVQSGQAASGASRWPPVSSTGESFPGEEDSDLFEEMVLDADEAAALAAHGEDIEVVEVMEGPEPAPQGPSSSPPLR